MSKILYQGTKQLYAEAMTRGAYNQYRGWDLPAGEDPASEGYIVEYADGGKPNMPDRTGYVSWSPKDVFERAYKPIGTHPQRVLLELDELGERLHKLDGFLETPTFRSLAFVEQERLTVQSQVMHTYYEILRQRIEFFGGLS